MTELRQKLKDFEAELSAMVMEFHTANNIEPLMYKISPVFFGNKRAIGDRLKFFTYDITCTHNDFKELAEPIISVIKSAVRDFCFENDITYLQGEIGYVATHENKLLQVYTDLLVKP